jgi:hypothetical protein
MSYTSATTSATLTLSGVNSSQEAAQLYVDWLVNNPDETPECAPTDATAEEILDEVLPYISFEDGAVVISLDTESDDGNYNSEYFDSITSHLRSIMSSELMTVNWSVFDSRDGISSGTDYSDSEGKYVNIVTDIKAMDRIASLMSGSDWSPDTLERIADIVRETGRTIDDL